MPKKLLFILWAVLFALCAALGFLPEPEGALQILLSLLFFLPPLILIWQARQKKDRLTLALLRNLSLLSLGITLIALIANFLAFSAGETLGRILYFFLVIVSTPMICSGYWVLSLFLWAFVMFFAISSLKSLKKEK